MIQALADKIIIEVTKALKTKGGLILPESSSAEPQGYGKVISCGESVENVTIGDYVIFHQRAGMDILMNNKVLKVLKYDELYGLLTDSEIQETLLPVTIGN